MRRFEKGDLLAADDLNDMVDNINRAQGSPTSTEYAGSGGSMYGLKRKPLQYPNWQKISFTRSIQSNPLVVRKGNICFDYPVATIYPVIETTLTLTGTSDVYVYLFWSRTAPATNGVTFTSDAAVLKSTSTEARFPLAKYKYWSDDAIFQIDENYWQGGDIYVDRIEIDNISIDTNTSKQEQVGGWSTVDPVTPATDSVQYFGRKSKGGAYEYSTLEGIVKNVKNREAVAKAINDGGAGSTITNISITAQSHNSLSNLDADIGIHNHSAFLFQNGTAGAGATHNQCSGIGSTYNGRYINLDNGVLSTGGYEPVDWVNRFLAGGDWTLKATANHLIIEGTGIADTTNSSIRSAGGAYLAAGVYALKGAAAQAGKFVNGAMSATLVGSYAAYFYDGTNDVRICSYSGRAIAALVGAIDANATSGFSCDGTTGVTIANWLKGGIVIGSLTEISSGDLLPSDKILVRRV